MRIRQTSCRHCGLDIEGYSRCRWNGQVIQGAWRDRGNNAHCNDGKHLHAPTPERRKPYDRKKE